MIFLVLEILISSVLLLIFYCKYKFRYWKTRNVPYIEPEIPFGNWKEHILQRLSMRETHSKLLKKYQNSEIPYLGIYIFTKPVLLVLSPDFAKKVFVEDFEYFNERILYFNEENDPLSANILFLHGEKWKFIRNKITPTFTTSRIKTMFGRILDCAKNMENELKKIENGEPFEARDMTSRYLLDIIAYTAYGLELNTFKDRNNEFLRHANRVKNRTTADLIRGFISMVSPSLMTALKLRIFPKEASDFFLGVIKKTVAYREKNGIERNDFLNLMIQLKNKGHLEGEKDDHQGKLTVTQIAAHSFLFYLAGFDTSSITLSSFIYEVAKHPEVQEKCRQEILEVLKKHNGELTYEGLAELTYMKQVIDETLRLHPISEIITRVLSKNYKVPNTDLVLDKGLCVLIPVADMHKNPKYFPNPDTFDPDRFSPERKDEIIPYTYMPFGHGPRICLGMRFAYIQMKVAIVSMLKNYRFTVNPKTREPLKQAPTAFLNDYVGGIWVNIEKIN